MKLSNKSIITVLLILLVACSVLLYINYSKKIFLQKNVDLIFTDAISKSMGGLAMDYSKIDNIQKLKYYEQTLSNLHDALNIFHLTSYKKYDNLFLALNRLYFHLLENPSDDYEIEVKSNIFEFLGKIMVVPDDSQLLSDFNHFLDSKNK
jgi:hypothetical protein